MLKRQKTAKKILYRRIIFKKREKFFPEAKEK
mgnify:CR=1 FL=1